MATVTVIVPAYNAAQYIRPTLESVRSQTLKDFECIIVNDCSTDETANIALEVVRSDSRFKLVSHRANSGLSASRNTGIRLTSSPLLALLDADDLLMSDSLHRRVHTLLNNYGKIVAGTYCGSISIKDNVIVPPSSTKTGNTKVIDFLSTAGACPFNALQPLLYTRIVRNVGGFNEHLSQAEDYDIWARILRAGYIFVPTPYTGVCYRATPGSMVKKGPLEHLRVSVSCYQSAHRFDSTSYACPMDGYSLNKPWIEYKKQLDLAPRILEFSGMALASGADRAEIAAVIASEIPDIFGVVGHHREAKELVLNGIKRYASANLTASDTLVRRHIENEVQNLLFDARAQIDHGTAEIKSTTSVDFAFFPHKDYHVWTIGLLAPLLKQLSKSFVIVDMTAQYRNEGVRRKAAELQLPLIGYSNFVLGSVSPKALVAFNDWDPIVRSIFHAAQNTGVATIGIVEGIQDYEDVDTGREREAYRTATHLILPGEFDKRYFRDTLQSLYVGGIPRISELRGKRGSPHGTRVALINSNFSYNVLTEHRDDWVKQAVEACRESGFECVISRHPADLGNAHEELTTTKTFYEATNEADVVIQRFASGILEALALGRSVIYFNPHNEKVDKFKEPCGAYPIANSKAELNELLKDPAALYSSSAKWDAFLDLHCGPMEKHQGSKITEILSAIADGVDIKHIDWLAFKRNLLGVDLISEALLKPSGLLDRFPATFGKRYQRQAVNRDQFWSLLRDRLANVADDIQSIRQQLETSSKATLSSDCSKDDQQSSSQHFIEAEKPLNGQKQNESIRPSNLRPRVVVANRSNGSKRFTKKLAVRTKMIVAQCLISLQCSKFDGLAYLEANIDVSEAVASGRIESALEHYIRHGCKEGRAYPFVAGRPPNKGRLMDMFDGLAYLATHPDVAEAVRSRKIRSALEHFVKYGHKEGRKVAMRFDNAARSGSALDLETKVYECSV